MDELEELRIEYARELPGRLDEIERLWNRVDYSTPDFQTITDVRNLVHKLAGSGSLYGFEGLSESAGELDSLLKRLDRSEIELTEEVLARILALLNRMKESIRLT
ncbi:MAG: Hpt domain-containing protein [Deltaproteobacteria bacterium]|nr:Hpt domain-containing protein [Deltaproteobacteria bacterium]